MSTNQEWRPIPVSALDGIEWETPDGLVQLVREVRRGSEQYRYSIITPDGGDTDDPATWSTVERYIPREQWPEEITVGQHGPKVRKLHPQVQAWVEQSRADDPETLQ